MKTIHFSLTSGWAFVGTILIVKSDKSFFIIFNGIIILSVLAALFAIKEYINNTVPTQLTVFGSDYLALGRLLGVSILLLLSEILLKKTSFSKMIFKVVVLLFLLLILIVSGGRAPLILLIITILIFLVFQVSIYKTKLVYNKFLPVIIIFLVSLITIFFKTNLTIFETFKTRLQFLSTQSGGGDSASGRIERFKTSYSMFKDSPILGKGIDSFSIYFNSPNDYPHNIFLEIASELGIIGIFLLLLIILYSLYNLLVSQKQYKYNKLLYWEVLLIFIYTFLNANISGDIIGNRILFVSFGLMIAFANISKINFNDK